MWSVNGGTSPVQTLTGSVDGRRLARQDERHAELAAIIRLGVLRQSGRFAAYARCQGGLRR